MNRRHFLRSVAAISALGAAEFAPWQAMSAFAGEVDDFVRGPAIKDYPLRQISPHVAIIFTPDGFPTPENQGMMSNVTFVDTRQGIVVVDSGASVQIGEMSIRQLERHLKKPVIAIINTHYHGDHWLGNHAYVERYGAGLPIYAHPATIDAVKGIQGNLWLSDDGLIAGAPTLDGLSDEALKELLQELLTENSQVKYFTICGKDNWTPNCLLKICAMGLFQSKTPISPAPIGNVGHPVAKKLFSGHSKARTTEPAKINRKEGACRVDLILPFKSR